VRWADKISEVNFFVVFQIDVKRNGVFIVFGFIYLGGFQYFVLVNKVSIYIDVSQESRPIYQTHDHHPSSR
jgi:hypothetical protein